MNPTARRRLPIALTIAGSDSGGGAGIQADLKTFAALGTHGTTAITCLTAQNPRGVTAIQAARPALVRAQIEAVFAELRPAAAKTGMLFSAPIIAAVVEACAELGLGRPADGTAPPARPSNRVDASGRAVRTFQVPLVVDPVMVATSGACLLQPSAIRRLCQSLLPRATLVTPNLDEAALLTGLRLSTEEDLRSAARAVHERYGCAVLVKGGHLRGTRHAVDVYYDGRNELLLSAPLIRRVSTHGTGCTYAAAITAGVARGLDLPDAVARAKDYITRAIDGSFRIGRHQTLAHGSVPLAK